MHVDASEISSIIDNAFTLFALDRNGIMCDNILAYLPYVYSTFTTKELSANLLYNPEADKPWWELAWNTVVSWFASVVKWFNNLDVGWKIGIGLALFALACIITAITAYFTGPGGTAAVAAALYKVFLDFAIGVVSAFAFTAISMAITGDFSLETLGGAVADAIFWGGVFAFVSASVNAVKAGIRGIKAANKPCETPNHLGKKGEDYISQKTGLRKNTDQFTETLSGKTRIPDFIDKKRGILIESKNVARQGMTQQLRDYVGIAKAKGWTMELYVRQGTKLSKNIDPFIIIKYFPW